MQWITSTFIYMSGGEWTPKQWVGKKILYPQDSNIQLKLGIAIKTVSASSPGPFIHGEGPSTHWMHILYFATKKWEFGFYRKMCSMLLRVEIVNYPFHASSLCLCENLLCLWTSIFNFALYFSLASSLWRLLKVRFMVQGSMSSSWRVGEGPGDEARWIQVFSCLKQWMILLST